MSDDSNGLNEKFDAIDRYEHMVNIQIQTLDGIDNKAEYLTRYIAVLLALVFTGASFVVDDLGSVEPGWSILLPSILGLGGLAVALIFSTITYLSSTFQYGPNRDFALDVANQDIGQKTYAEIMLRAYRDALYQNKKVVQQNSKRFKIALNSLLVGILFLTAGAVGFLGGFKMYLSAMLVTLVLALVLSWYILTEQYLVLEPEKLSHE